MIDIRLPRGGVSSSFFLLVSTVLLYGSQVHYDSLKTEEGTYWRWQVSDSGYFRNIEARPFSTGEFLRFSIGWEALRGGEATLHVSKEITIGAVPCWQIEARASSNRFISWFFKVRDTINSYLRKDGLYSMGFEKHLKEGGFRADYEVRFDHDSLLARHGGKTFPIPPFINDAIGEFYFARSLPLKVGSSYHLLNFDNNKLFPIHLTVTGKESIHVGAGKFDCVILEPVLQSGAVFKNEGKIKIWVTDDESHVPVLVKSKALIGSIVIELEEYRPRD